jgi:hypothetical protein
MRPYFVVLTLKDLTAALFFILVETSFFSLGPLAAAGFPAGPAGSAERYGAACQARHVGTEGVHRTEGTAPWEGCREGVAFRRGGSGGCCCTAEPARGAGSS